MYKAKCYVCKRMYDDDEDPYWSDDGELICPSCLKNKIKYTGRAKVNVNKEEVEIIEQLLSLDNLSK